MLKIAREKVSEVDFIYGDMKKLEIESNLMLLSVYSQPSIITPIIPNSNLHSQTSTNIWKMVGF